MPYAEPSTTITYTAPSVHCQCGHNQARHELPGFEGECIALGCRCVLYRPVTAPAAPGQPAAVPTAPPRITSVEQLVTVARETGDRRALLLIGRVQAITDELRALVAAHYARARDDRFKTKLAALPDSSAAYRLPKNKTCDICGRDDLANVGVHKRNAHGTRKAAS